MRAFLPTYCFLLLSVWASLCFAQTPYVFQTQDPIANFAWDENDTSRYAGHYVALDEGEDLAVGRVGLADEGALVAVGDVALRDGEGALLHDLGLDDVLDLLDGRCAVALGADLYQVSR